MINTIGDYFTAPEYINLRGKVLMYNFGSHIKYYTPLPVRNSQGKIEGWLMLKLNTQGNDLIQPSPVGGIVPLTSEYEFSKADLEALFNYTLNVEKLVITERYLSEFENNY